MKQEIKTVQLEEVLNERADEEMDVSDEEDYMGNKKRVRYDTSEEKASLKRIYLLVVWWETERERRRKADSLKQLTLFIAANL
uniref:Uncharacterized protein n=1 Tax=Timema genevievae TaxID=629358 RepID=A0A7R9K6Z2_TIMGE|nr:unnamed protein product [Timema genevievae]